MGIARARAGGARALPRGEGLDHRERREPDGQSGRRRRRRLRVRHQPDTAHARTHDPRPPCDGLAGQPRDRPDRALCRAHAGRRRIARRAGKRIDRHLAAAPLDLYRRQRREVCRGRKLRLRRAAHQNRGAELLVQRLDARRDVHRVADGDTSLSLANGEIVPFTSMISLIPAGVTISLNILRQGKKIVIPVVTRHIDITIPIMEYQMAPSYMIIGGLVFIPVSYMSLIEKKKMGEDVSYSVDLPKGKAKESSQLIMLSEIFNNDMTEGYAADNIIVKSLNGHPIINLSQFHRLVKTELKKSKFLVFQFANSLQIIVLNSNQVVKNHKRILLDNIGHDKDLLDPSVEGGDAEEPESDTNGDCPNA